MVSVETSSKFPSWCNCPLESKWCTELRILVAVDSGNLKQSLDEIVTAACSIDSSCFLLCSERSTFRLGTGRMFASHIFASSHEVLVVRAFPQHSCHFVWKCLHLGFRWCQRSFGSGTSQTWSTRSRCGGTHSIATVWTGEAPRHQGRYRSQPYPGHDCCREAVGLGLKWTRSTRTWDPWWYRSASANSFEGTMMSLLNSNLGSSSIV